MKNFILSLFSVTVILLTQCTTQKNDSQDDTKAIENLIEDYITTINTCDTTLVNKIWSDAEFVSFIAPSGYYAGRDEIRDSLIVNLFGKNFIKRELKKNSLKININGNSAWSEFYWTFDALKNDSTPHNTRGRETQIFQKDSRGLWKLTHIHYSSAN